LSKERVRESSLLIFRVAMNPLTPSPKLSWGRVGVGVDAVLNLCENRLFLKQQKSARGSAARKQTSGASTLDPHLSPPPRLLGEEVRGEKVRPCESRKALWDKER
jgi:hypothetical protein